MTVTSGPLEEYSRLNSKDLETASVRTRPSVVRFLHKGYDIVVRLAADSVHTKWSLGAAPGQVN